MPGFKVLTLVVLFIKYATSDELTACYKNQCSCADYSGRHEKNIRCREIADCTINIEYKESDYVKIYCFDEDFYVDELDFDFSSIKTLNIENCKLPSGLSFFEKWHLTNVTELLLKKTITLGTDGIIENDFFDKIPKGSIEKLSIKACDIKAIRQEAFKGFNNLTRLDFENNMLTEVLDIFKNLPSLRMLDLHNNLIQTLPNGITAPNLKILYLNINNITFLDELTFVNTPNLTLLELSINRIQDLPQNLLRPLKKLHSVNFGIEGNVTVQNLFAENPELTVVRFRGGNITLISPEAFKNLSKLQMLSIYNSKLKALPEGLFESNENIEEIFLNENDISELPKGIFKNLKKLKKLDLSVNKLTQWKKEYFEKGLDSLVELNLDKNKLERIDNLVFTDLPKLQTLSMNNNKIQNISREAFEQYSVIKELKLNFNQLHNDDNDSFNFLTNLVTLQLNNNTYDAVPNINHIPTLKTLLMRNNKVESLSFMDINTINKVDLTGNLIETVDFSIINVVTDNEMRSSLSALIINNNPFVCNCSMYDFFKLMNEKNNPKLKVEANNLNCTSPPDLRSKPVRDLTTSDLKCDLRRTESAQKYECPSNCKCTLFPANATLEVDCSNINLTSVPYIAAFKPFFETGVSYRNVFVNLSGNNIVEFPENFNYTNVNGLDLSRNHLNVIKWIPQNLKVLELHTNRLSRINEEVLSKLNNNTFLKQLSLHQNPWSCDCSSLDLTNSIRADLRKFFKEPEIVQCADSRPLIHLTKAELCEYPQTLIITLTVVILILAILTIVTSYFYVKYETTIKIWMFSHNIFVKFITEAEVDKGKKFDAFVSYSHKDEEFVERDLLPGLEGGPDPYKVCYHERDWEVGEFINKQIVESVNNSRRTIIVLSRNFLKSDWAATEFQTAHARSMEERRNRLIVILYDDLKPEDVDDEELRAYMKTNTYIKWSDPWFWKKLRYAMPHRNADKVDKAKQRMENFMISIDDKLDLTMSPTTPNTQTPPAMSLDPLLLKVNPLQFKTIEKIEKNEILSTPIC